MLHVKRMRDKLFERSVTVEQLLHRIDELVRTHAELSTTLSIRDLLAAMGIRFKSVLIDNEDAKMLNLSRADLELSTGTVVYRFLEMSFQNHYGEFPEQERRTVDQWLARRKLSEPVIKKIPIIVRR